MRRFKRLTALLLVFTMLVLVCPIQALAAEASDVLPAEALITAGEKALDYYSSKGIESWWEYFAAKSFAAEFEGGDTPVLPEDELAGAAATAYASRIIALITYGEDPRAYYEDMDLVNALASMQDEGGSFGGTVNNDIFAILALDDSYRVFYDRKAALSSLLSKQGADGSFGYGMGGDTDLTAMAVFALSKYKEPAAVKAADEAIAYLLEQRDENGAFISPWTGSENTCTLATVLSALAAANADLSKDDWGPSVEKLLSYQLESGAFEDGSGGAQEDFFSTYQALLAIGDLINGSMFHRFSLEFTPYIYEDADKVSAWAEVYVARAIELGLAIPGAGGLLEPQAALSRGELASIIDRSITGLRPTEPLSFEDLRPDHRFYRSVSEVSSHGIMVGYEGRFEPEKQLTRQDFALVIQRMCEYNELFSEEEYELITGESFSDLGESDAYAEEALLFTASVGLLEGFEGKLRPMDEVTKEEALKVFIILIDRYNEKAA